MGVSTLLVKHSLRSRAVNGTSPLAVEAAGPGKSDGAWRLELMPLGKAAAAAQQRVPPSLGRLF